MKHANSRLQYALWLVVAIVFVLYLPTLGFPFIGIDDDLYITSNLEVTAPHILTILSFKTLVVSDWTPLVALNHALEYALFGFWTPGFRAVQLGLHLLTLPILFSLLCALRVAPVTALLSVFLWGIHPLNIESVGWLASRKNVLALLFGLVFLQSVVKRAWLPALIALCLALMSKGTSTLFPLLAVCLASPFSKTHSSGPRREMLVWYSLFFTLALCRALISVDAQLEVVAQRGVADYSFLDRMSVMGRVFWFQCAQFFWPNNLALMYGWRSVSWSDPRVWGSWVGIATALTVIFARGRSKPEYLIGGAFLICGLLPTFNLTPAPLFQADRYFHTALIGLCVLAVTFARDILSGNRLLPITIVGFGTCVLIPFFIPRLATWRDTESVWRDMTARYPRYGPGWVRLGYELKKRGAYQQAEAAFEQARQLDPGSVEPRQALSELKQEQEARSGPIGLKRQLAEGHSESDSPIPQQPPQ